jgi:excisionase family DNA binding protein
MTETFNLMRKKRMEEMLSPKQLAKLMNVSLAKVYLMLVTGELKSVMIARGQRKKTLRVRPSDLEKFMKAREISQGEGL